MLIDLGRDRPTELAPTDVCIIGAGAAGITLARRLIERGRHVCLVEGGGFDFEKATQDLYRGANIGMPYHDLDQSRLRFFGGTVAIWGGRCAVLDPIDFTARGWVPHSGWPIGRAELDPWYRQAHALLELGPFNYDREVWRELGMPDPGFDPARLVGALWRFDEVAERFTAARCRALLAHPRLRVVLHANAVRLRADAQGRRIEQVELRSLGGASATITARRFVLACGAIENCRLLLASNDVEPHGIGNSRDQVGRFFMEHPTGRIGRIVTPRPFELWASLQKRFTRRGPPLAPVLRLGEAAQREHRTLNSAVTLKLQPDPSRGVALGNRLYHGIKHSLNPNQGGRALNRLYRTLRAWLHRSMRMTIERARTRIGVNQLYLIARGEQAPNPDSRVLLSAERDALGSRRADLDWRLSEIDKHTAQVLAQVFGDELRRLGRGSVTLSPWLSEPGAQWPLDFTVGNHPIAHYHHMGGTRMGNDPASSVVDADGRVHGYGNLFVAGSSVFPTGGWANPTLTIIALALRLAERLD